MKKIILICVLIKYNFLFPQFKVGDTLPHSNSINNCVKIKNGERFSSEIRYFKNSLNPLDQNKPLVDTIYNNSVANIENWKYYDGSIRIYLHNKSNLWIEKTTKNGSNKDPVFKKLNGTYYYLFKELENLQITISYTNDTNINFISLSILDTLKRGSFQKELYFLNRYKYPNGIKLDTGEANYIYNCGKVGTLEMRFSKKNLLNKILFYPKNIKQPSTVYEFYENFFCKSYFHYYNNIPTGLCYKYYENGNIRQIENHSNTKNNIKSFMYYKKDGTPSASQDIE